MKLSDIRDHVQDFDWKEFTLGIISMGLILITLIILSFILGA